MEFPFKLDCINQGSGAHHLFTVLFSLDPEQSLERLRNDVQKHWSLPVFFKHRDKQEEKRTEEENEESEGIVITSLYFGCFDESL